MCSLHYSSKMRKRKITLIICLVLTTINIMVFISRKNFEYYPFATYSELYAPCDEDCVKKWSQFQNDYPATELVEARKISDSIINDSKVSTAQKISVLAT